MAGGPWRLGWARRARGRRLRRLRVLRWLLSVFLVLLLIWALLAVAHAGLPFAKCSHYLLRRVPTDLDTGSVGSKRLSDVLSTIGVRNRPLRAEEQMRMTDASPSDTNQVELLLAKLTARAIRRGIPSRDAEDVALDAIAKAGVERTRPGAPSFERRAYKALEDTIPEYFRRPARKLPMDRGADISEFSDSPKLTPPGHEPPSDDPGQHFRVLEFAKRLCAEDPELLELAALSQCGYSDAEIARLPQWDRLRAQRVRKRLQRRAFAVLADLDIQHLRKKEAS
jgi:hypothetical protein